LLFIQRRDRLDRSSGITHAHDAAGILGSPVDPAVLSPVSSMKHVGVGERCGATAGERRFLKSAFRGKDGIALNEREEATVWREERRSISPGDIRTFKRADVQVADVSNRNRAGGGR